MSIWYYVLYDDGSFIPQEKNPRTNPDYVLDQTITKKEKKIFKVNTNNRFEVWDMIILARVLGANAERIEELREKWALTDEDLHKFLSKLKINMVVYHSINSIGENLYKLEFKPNTQENKVDYVQVERDHSSDLDWRKSLFSAVVKTVTDFNKDNL